MNFPLHLLTNLVKPKSMVASGEITQASAELEKLQQLEKLLSEVSASRALLLSIIDHIPAFIYIKDLEGKYSFVNNEFCTVMNRSRQELIGKTAAQIFNPQMSKVIEEQLALITKTKKSITVEEYMDVAVHRTEWLSIKFPIFDGKGEVVAIAGVSTDITQQKIQRVQLEQAAKMASLGEMSGGIAHEVSNPLTVIMGKSSMLRTMIEQDSPDTVKMLEHLDRIDLMGERISKIIRGLRLFSRNGEKDEFEWHSLASVVDETLAFCRHRLQLAGIELKVDIIPPDLQIRMSAVQISQIVLNLINNAMDAILIQPDPRSHPLEYRGQIWIQFLDRGQFIEVAVVDSGSGILPEHRDHVMIPFFTTKEVGKGVGLGLSLSKGIADRHRGTLLLDHAHKQTRFVLSLPKNAV